MSKMRVNPAGTGADISRAPEFVFLISGDIWLRSLPTPSLRQPLFAKREWLATRSRVAAKRGGAYRDRTDDPLLAKQVLSQLS